MPKLLAGFKALTKKLSKAFKAATFLVASCAPGSDTAVTGTPVPRIARLLALDLTKMGKEHGAEMIAYMEEIPSILKANVKELIKLGPKVLKQFMRIVKRFVQDIRGAFLSWSTPELTDAPNPIEEL